MSTDATGRGREGQLPSLLLECDGLPLDRFSGPSGVDPDACSIIHASGKRDSDTRTCPDLVSDSAFSADSSIPGTNTDRNASAFFSPSLDNSLA